MLRQKLGGRREKQPESSKGDKNRQVRAHAWVKEKYSVEKDRSRTVDRIAQYKERGKGDRESINRKSAICGRLGEEGRPKRSTGRRVGTGAKDRRGAHAGSERENSGELK